MGDNITKKHWKAVRNHASPFWGIFNAFYKCGKHIKSSSISKNAEAIIRIAKGFDPEMEFTFSNGKLGTI